MSAEAFDPAWLDLREATDHRARAEGLLADVRAWWSRTGSSRVLDLGSGTGSNLRYLAPRLDGPQSWTLLDHDPGLLARAESPVPEVTVVRVTGDLADEGLRRIAAADLVTASALLDLVSEAWVDALVAACASARSAALFALSYDGSISWGRPSADSDDELVRAALAEHQRRDKGLGPALGPTASGVAAAAFADAGYRVRTAAAPWRLGPGDRALASALVAGWAEAATEQRPDEAERIRGWAGRRAEEVARGSFRLTVGHVDLVAIPAPPETG